MTEFAKQWSKLSTSQRRTVRADMEAKAMASLTRTGFSFVATTRQLKSAAKKLVDRSISKARKFDGPAVAA